MKVIFLDTRAFSMARKMRCNGLGSVSLFLVAASFALTTPALARETADAFLSNPMAPAAAVELALVRPAPRPVFDASPVQVSRNLTVAPAAILAPAPQGRSRIRQSWVIGVFR
jgi:hypothetical protein